MAAELGFEAYNHADETTREYLGIISSEIHNAEKIVSGLLDLSRSRQSRGHPLKRAAHSVLPVVL